MKLNENAVMRKKARLSQAVFNWKNESRGQKS